MKFFNQSQKNNFSFTRVFSLPKTPRGQFRLLIIFALLLLIATGCFHMYFLYRIESQTIFNDTLVGIPPAPKVNEKKLESVLARYREREVVQKSARTLVPPVAEPSR